MTNLFEELCERIRGEVPELERAVDRALGAWVHAQQTPDEYAYLDSVALNLHLTPERNAGLMAALPAMWAMLQAELLAFADYLEALGR